MLLEPAPNVSKQQQLRVRVQLADQQLEHLAPADQQVLQQLKLLKQLKPPLLTRQLLS
jgi:hypothetical protein